METIAERRRRKLIALVEANGGLARLASKCDVSAASLDQVIKRTPMSRPKQDGTKSVKALGDSSARKIEDALRLGRGWFDGPDESVASPPDTATTAPREPGEIEGALRVLAEAMKAADAETRAAVAPLFALLAQQPERLESVTSTLMRLIPERNLTAHNLQDDQREGREITAHFPSLANKEQQGAKRNPVQSRGRT